MPNTLAELLGRMLKATPSPDTATPKPHLAIPQRSATSPQPVNLPAATQAIPKAAAKQPSSSPAQTKPLRRAVAPLASTPLNALDLKGGELVVSNVSQTARTQLASRGFAIAGTHSFATLGQLLTTVTLPPDMSAREARAFMRAVAPDSSVAVNHRYELYAPSTEEQQETSRPSGGRAHETGGCASSRCYGSSVIGWKSELDSCARGIRVGVIDTGIDMTHPALKRHRIYVGKISPTGSTSSTDMHGTGVLALLAGDKQSTTPGLIPGATFYIADIFFPDEHGRPVSTTMHLLSALDWMAQLDVQIVNLSLSGPRDPLVQSIIATMSRPRPSGNGKSRPGTLFVAAAGNGGPGAPPSYPAAYTEVVAVTAVNKDLHSYRRANHGDYIDVAAPGVDIWTAMPGGRQGYQSGTSFATPYMTAIAAATYRGLPGTKSKEELLQRVAVQDLGPPGRDRIYGRGLVQAPQGCNAPVSQRPSRSFTSRWTTYTAASQPPPQRPNSRVDNAWVVNVARSPAE